MVSALVSCHISVILSLFSLFGLSTEDRNASADNIVGNYHVEHDGELSRVAITSCPDGTYQARVYWIKDSTDENGRKRLDVKNPDRELRKTPCDQILLIWDLKYNPEKQRWDKGKIYDPTRGIRANATASFREDGALLIRGSLLGISETVIWQPLPPGEK